ncbi:MAG TPA: THUMP domain-containing protein [Burkholderiales bacterium]|nr:THUMP domain-containing protein [Burkholderiales bacterium]
MEHFFASAPRGLEPLLSAELTGLGARNAAAVPGGVAFAGDWRVCYAANLWSRIASRVLWRVAEFDYRDDSDLHEAARKVDWMRLFAVDRTLRVNVSAQKSPLTSLDFATLRIKDAVCDRFRETLGSRPDIDRANPDVRVHAFLEAARGAFYLDTSGEPLFKRGWRAGAGEAPLRENLAAGLVLLSGWKPEEPLLDPMCGGATLLVEAAAMARGRAPGASRHFGFEKLKSYDPSLWERVKKDGHSKSPPKSLQIFGSDHDPRVLNDARRNIAAAGVDRWVKLEQADILERTAPASAGVMIANPPYGERIGSKEELAEFYPKLGSVLKKNYPGWRCHLFTADMRLPKLVRLLPARRVPLFNGALECRLFEFAIVAGSNRR